MSDRYSSRVHERRSAISSALLAYLVHLAGASRMRPSSRLISTPRSTTLLEGVCSLSVRRPKLLKVALTASK